MLATGAEVRLERTCPCGSFFRPLVVRLTTALCGGVSRPGASCGPARRWWLLWTTEPQPANIELKAARRAKTFRLCPTEPQPGGPGSSSATTDTHETASTAARR